MKFLADANVSPAAARLLNAFDQQNEVHAHAEFWRQDAPDTEWIRELRSKLEDPHPIILGGDGRILKNKPELIVLKEEELTFVCLAPGWTNLPWAEFAWKIVKAWPGIVANPKAAMRPTVFEVKANSLKCEKVKALADYRVRR